MLHEDNVIANIKIWVIISVHFIANIKFYISKLMNFYYKNIMLDETFLWKSCQHLAVMRQGLLVLYSIYSHYFILIYLELCHDMMYLHCIMYEHMEALLKRLCYILIKRLLMRSISTTTKYSNNNQNVNHILYRGASNFKEL